MCGEIRLGESESESVKNCWGNFGWVSLCVFLFFFFFFGLCFSFFVVLCF